MAIIKFLKGSTISLVYGNPEKRSWQEPLTLGYFSASIKLVDNDRSLAAKDQLLTAVQVTPTSSYVTTIINLVFYLAEKRIHHCLLIRAHNCL